MLGVKMIESRIAVRLIVLSGAVLLLIPSVPLQAQQGGDLRAAEASEITFHRDIAPILQNSCQRCHHDGGVGPMLLVTYEDVRPYARRIVRRTQIRDRAGAMPPWYVEKDIGIQHFKDDTSLDDEQLAALDAWWRNGAPEGDPTQAPAPIVFSDDVTWSAGEPDLIVELPEMLVEGDAADWWGDIENVPTGLTEDRYVSSVEVREVNDVMAARAGEEPGRRTVGGRFVVHHMIWSTRVVDDGRDTGPGAERNETDVGWPVHEVGRDADIFDENGGRLLRAGSSVVSNSIHLHSNGRDTRSHLEIGFRFHPKGYEPQYKALLLGFGNGSDIDIEAGKSDQELHAYKVLNEHTKIVTFEPHLHAPGQRMCLEAIWGFNVETLNCIGYDHNWVRGYTYAPDSQPLLPKGTVLHIVGYMDNSETNQNVPDPRNWQGSGNRSVANMFIDLGMRLELTDEQFAQEMADRRAKLGLTVNDHVIGCPLCLVMPAHGKAANVTDDESDGSGGNGDETGAPEG